MKIIYVVINIKLCAVNCNCPYQELCKTTKNIFGLRRLPRLMNSVYFKTDSKKMSCKQKKHWKPTVSKFNEILLILNDEQKRTEQSCRNLNLSFADM